MEQKDSDFFKSLFKEPLDESLGETKDKALNYFLSQFGNPSISDVQFECIDTVKPNSKTRERKILKGDSDAEER